MRFLFPLLLLVPSSRLACRGDALNGGSNTSSSSGSPSTPSEAGAPPADDLPTTPFSGTVTGKPFVPTAFELRPQPKTTLWTLEIHNASTPCAQGRALGDSIVIVTIQGLSDQGVSSLDRGEASFQRGFYTTADNKDPEHDSNSEGRVRLDIAPGATGTKVTGALDVKGSTSQLGGTFTATVCAPL